MAATPDIPTRAAKQIFVVGLGADPELLSETLALAPDVWSADSNAPDVVDLVPALHPAARDWESGRLDAGAVTPDVVSALEPLLVARARDRDDRPPPASSVVVLDGSPLHALRVPFLAEAFPDSCFVFVQRDATTSFTALVNQWLAQRFVTYPGLPDWPGPGWTGPLVSGWRDLAGQPLGHNVALQWRDVVTTLIADLERLPGARWAVVSYERLVADPQREIARLCAFLGLDWDRTLTAPLTGRISVEDRVDAHALAQVLPLIEPSAAAAADLVADDEQPSASAPRPASSPFGSTYSPGFPELLSTLGVSLLVTTYQSGRVILCRADGRQLNTHFRMLPVPMGIAVDETRITVGTERRIFTYRNHPSAVALLGDDRYDACFLPLHAHVTGNIQVHELAYVEAALWAVSTRFSCLVRFDDDHSFVPAWQPPFVTALAAEDRCHLNGMAVADGRVAFATVLGLTDAPAGWREEKGTGGAVLDVPSGDVVAHGLSMPHSPRWHDGRLWVLESGKGSLANVDVATGEVETVAELPGFTRGLAFAGPYAFVGLSQVRESVFRGLPVVQRQQRECGVQVVDLRTGAVVASLTFTGSVQEIFDVQVLPWRWPELSELDGEFLNNSFALPAPAR